DDALHGIEGWKHMASAIRPAIWDEAAADEHLTMATDDAIATARRLAREEGILSGPSGGGAVAAALQVAREQDGVVVALLADGGERYLSTPMWE
ncbi:MAG TPA: cysteine synthase, partial [Candidatus Limnocylindria bacterium]